VLHPAHRLARERRIKNPNKLAVLCPRDHQCRAAAPLPRTSQRNKKALNANASRNGFLNGQKWRTGCAGCVSILKRRHQPPPRRGACWNRSPGRLRHIADNLINIGRVMEQVGEPQQDLTTIGILKPAPQTGFALPRADGRNAAITALRPKVASPPAHRTPATRDGREAAFEFCNDRGAAARRRSRCGTGQCSTVLRRRERCIVVSF
jgi:hypothetical protein